MTEADHELILEGPSPYFSTPYIWVAKCRCGAYSTGKVASESNARKQHAQHVKDKMANEQKPKELQGQNWDSPYERALRKL